MSTPTPEPSQTQAIPASVPPADRTLLQPPSSPPPDPTLVHADSVPPADHTLLQTPADLQNPADPPTARVEGGWSPPSDGGTIAQAPLPAALRAAVLREINIPGYEVLGELGRGGMGVVYKARQVGLNRVVALKMILSGDYAAAGDLARFRLEAEAVAQFQHPNIVQIYAIDEVKGRPYFCLEFVDGGPLHKKLAGDPQPPRQAAELVRQLAAAMDYAHQRHIIHRDLKPANVLVTADGVPKIADFGLAKKLDDADSRTQSGSVLGTPSYMAPEQSRGADVGPAADVYSLGAILYEALVGRPPFKGETVLDTLEQVRSQEPVPPSRLRPKLPRDLETICLKCLEKNPKSRYAGAGDLAEDLRRFLAREPIRARPTPAWERAWKWARRRPVAAALTAVSVLFVLSLAAGGAAFGEYQRRQADNEARLLGVAEAADQRAERNFENARSAVDEMLTAVGQVRLAHEPRMEQIRRDLLARALHFQEQFLQDKSDDPAVRREAGRAHLRMGDIERMLGDQAAAETSYGAAREFFTALAAEHPDDARYQQDLSACLNNLGQLLREDGRTPEAEQTLGEALDLRRKLVSESGREEDRKEEAAVADNLGTLLLGMGRYTEAEALLRESLDGREALAASAAGAGPRLDLARGRDNLGALLAATGRTDDAAHVFGQALLVLKELSDARPDVPEYRQELAVTHNHLGNLWRDTDPKKSEDEYAQSLQLRDGLSADFPTVPTYKEEQAASWHSLGYVRQAAGRQEDADAAYDKAVTIEEKLAADYPTVPDYQYDLCASYTNRGVLLQTNNRPAEAEELYNKALPRLEKLEKDHPDTPAYTQQLAATLQDLGGVYQTTNRPQKAEKSLARSVELRRKLVALHPKAPAYEQDLAGAMLNLGVFWRIKGNPDEAGTCFDRAVGRLTKLADLYPATPDYRHLEATALNDRGNLLAATNRPADAEKDWRKAVDLLTQLKDEQPAVPVYRQELASSLQEYGIFLASHERGPEAEKTMARALTLQEKLSADFPKNDAYREGLAKLHGNMGVLHAQAGRLVPAEQNYRKNIEIIEELTRANPAALVYQQDLIGPSTNLIHLLTATGAPADELDKCWRRLVACYEKLTAAYPAAADLQSDLGAALESLAGLPRGEGRAETRDHLQEAMRRQRIALKLAPDNAAYRQRLCSHLLALARTQLDLNDHAAAAGAVADLLAAAPPGWKDRPAAAACLSRCAGLAAGDATLTPAKREELARAYGDRAMAALRQAAEGFQDADYLKKADFEPLRSRDDFKRLEGDLRKK